MPTDDAPADPEGPTDPPPPDLGDDAGSWDPAPGWLTPAVAAAGLAALGAAWAAARLFAG